MEKGFSPIDKLFNEKLSDYEISGKKGNWELLRYLIKEEQKKATFFRKLKLMIFSGIGFVFIFSMMLLLYNNSKKTTNPLANKHTNAIEYQENMFSNDFQKQSLNEPKITHSNNSNGVVQSEINQPTNQANLPHERHPPTAKKDNTIKRNTLHNQNYSKNYIYNNIYPTNKVNAASDWQDWQAQNNSSEDAYYSIIPIEHHFNINKDSIKIEITNLGSGVNSAFIDYGPVVTADGEIMYFTSSKTGSETKKKRNKKDFENIYSGVFNQKTKKWGNTQLLPFPVNVKDRNNSVIGLSNDGQRMLLYRDNDQGIGDIYESTLNGTQWSDPVMLPEPINSKYHESSATISPDGHTIYFVSERPGGLGKKDIWFATQDKNGIWGNAVNMQSINTTEDEDGVFIHPDGKTLYFSSKRAGGFGGYDIYKSVFENGNWSKPKNIGQPLNTEGNDIYFVMEANGRVGYYASGKSGGLGGADIYKVAFIPVKVRKEYTAKLTLFKGKVVDKQTRQPIEAAIEITDLIKNEVVSKTKSNSATGKFLISLPFGINYGISVKKEGYLFYSDNVSIDTGAYKEIVKWIELEKLKVGKSIVLRNIFYDYNKANLRKESIPELEQLVVLLKKQPSLKIEIGAHTDNRGTTIYNNKLSQARAQSVVAYLTTKGVSKERLVAKGYGETSPIASNQHADGSDNPEGRQLNRRTEFKIIEN